MPTVTEAIQAFLRAKRATHNDPELLDRWTPSLETQVNVAAGSGEPVHGKAHTYTDGVREWWPIRMPKHADTEPEFNDYVLRWPLSEHAEAIGCTGWDWKSRTSKWCGFDFDSITGHSAGVGISGEQLEAVKQAVQDVPWVEVRKSTGGSGLHLYVYFDDVPTANHHEHAALARAVLGMLSSEANFDFASQIDACGGNMWIWHRKMTAANEGLKLLKPHVDLLRSLPANWKDNVEVVTRKRKKMRLSKLDVKDEGDFEALATSRKIVPLGEKHKAVMQKLADLGHPTIWVPDYHLLQTHTNGLADLCEPDNRAELDIKGFFQTLSSGSTEINCFCFPLADGGWKVVRFGRGLKEAATWQHDGNSWTWCYFDRVPDLDAASRAYGATELDNNRGWKFKKATDALSAANMLGAELSLPPQFHERAAILRTNKDGRLVIDVAKTDDDAEPDETWFDKRGWWSKVSQARTEGAGDENNDFDHVLRIVMTPAGAHAGTYISTATGHWDVHQQGIVRMYLQGQGHTKKRAEEMIGEAAHRRWERVSLPFQPEYPGSRRWNFGAPQLKCRPSDSRDGNSHPHWDRIFDHCGQSLTPVLREQKWAQQSNVLTGGDYLRAWFACILREPFARLPYLFLHGPENCGKSILWEAFSHCLVTKGVVKADRALMNNNDFNPELEGAILCVIEEKNISTTPGALNRIRDYITAPYLSIRRLYCDPYTVPNATHWLHNSNDLDAVPIAQGDTRITVIEVPALGYGMDIPKDTVLMPALASEASAFLRTLLDLPLPAAQGRLRLPVVETAHKQQIAAMHRNPIEQFLAETCFHVPGNKVTLAEFCERFSKSLPESERPAWGKHRITRLLPAQYPHGSGGGNIKFVGNLSFEDIPCVDCRPWQAVGNRLVREETTT